MSNTEKTAFVDAVLKGMEDAKAGRTTDAAVAMKRIAKQFGLPVPAIGKVRTKRQSG